MALNHEQRVAHDVEQREAWDREARAVARLASARKSLDSVRKRDRESGRPGSLEWSLRNAEAEANAARADYGVAHAEVERLRAIFEAEGGWQRYWLVANQDGHVHTSVACPTCFSTTRFAFLAELSDTPVQDVVAEYGDDVCTVCVEYAPVGRRKSEEEAQAAKSERAAAKAERERKKAEKAITQRDGQPLRELGRGYDDVGRGYVIETLATAKRLATDAFEDALYSVEIAFGVQKDDPTHNLRLAAARVAQGVYLVDAIAAKTGQDPKAVLAEHLAKGTKKAKKGASVALPEAERFVAGHLATIGEYLEAIENRA